MRPRRFSFEAILFGVLALCFSLLARPTAAADVVVVADTRLKLVAEVVSTIKKSVSAAVATYPLSGSNEPLSVVVKRERPIMVIALGRDALMVTEEIPTDIPVVYGLVLTPPPSNRRNMTGVYMAVPVTEYGALIDRYLPTLKRVAVIGSRDQLTFLDTRRHERWSALAVKTPLEFVDTLKRLEGVDAVLLLPNIALLTPSAMEEAFLVSYRKPIPLLGVSEPQVRDGALLALVADPSDIGKRIAEYAAAVLSGTSPEQLQPAPARHFNLYLNTAIAKKADISIPQELLKQATKVYP